jgi:hypothetical protein
VLLIQGLKILDDPGQRGVFAKPGRRRWVSHVRV